jgi:hypothetical protein
VDRQGGASSDQGTKIPSTRLVVWASWGLVLGSTTATSALPLG